MDKEELLERYAAGERNFGNADLRGLDLSRLNLSGIDLRFANLEATNLSRANLSKAYMERTNINNTILIEANIQDSFIEGILNSDLRGANLDRIRMFNGLIWNCDLEGASLRNADLSNVGIESTNLRNANLTETKGEFFIKDVDLTGAIGFDLKAVGAGYWNLTLPDGTFIADWEAE